MPFLGSVSKVGSPGMSKWEQLTVPLGIPRIPGGSRAYLHLDIPPGMLFPHVPKTKNDFESSIPILTVHRSGRLSPNWEFSLSANINNFPTKWRRDRQFARPTVSNFIPVKIKCLCQCNHKIIFPRGAGSSCVF